MRTRIKIINNEVFIPQWCLFGIFWCAFEDLYYSVEFTSLEEAEEFIRNQKEKDEITYKYV